jgi:hypothetical protein
LTVAISGTRYAAFATRMRDGFFNIPETRGEIEITLDGLPVELPLECCSLNAIRCHLETLALEKQRILCSLSVDGESVNFFMPLVHQEAFCRIEAETIALKETSILLLKRALQQAEYARECVETAITLVLINDVHVVRELWWDLARQLKEPVLTLSMLPDNACRPASGRTSPIQLRKWQLEQIAAIIKDVNRVCCSEEVIPLSDVLENRVLPWLQKLSEFISLWHETVMAGFRLGINDAVC